MDLRIVFFSFSILNIQVHADKSGNMTKTRMETSYTDKQFSLDMKMAVKPLSAQR